MDFPLGGDCLRLPSLPLQCLGGTLLCSSSYFYSFFSSLFFSFLLFSSLFFSFPHHLTFPFQGTATVQLGGAKREIIDVKCGDILLIPPGVAHKGLTQTPGFSVLGTYPKVSFLPLFPKNYPFLSLPLSLSLRKCSTIFSLFPTSTSPNTLLPGSTRG